MDRAYASGAAGSAPTPPASPSIGYPTSGNPATATPATKPGEWWYHMITEEIRAVIVAAGLTPDHEDLDQLSQAIAALGGVPDATETVKGKVELATSLEAQGFAAEKVIDGAKLAAAFKGANQSLAASGYQKLPGGLIIQWGSLSAVLSSGPNNGFYFPATAQSATFPIAFPDACLQVMQSPNESISGVEGSVTSLNVTASGFQFYMYGGLSGVTMTGRYLAIGY